jgi:hypothetical protein
LEITDLAEYQDATTGVVMYRDTPLETPAPRAKAKVPHFATPGGADCWYSTYPSIKTGAMLPQVGICHQHPAGVLRPNRPAVAW